MNLKLFTVLLVGVAMFSGCASSVKRDSDIGPTSFAMGEDLKIGSVDIVLTGKAKEKAKNNLKFDAVELKQVVERALEAYGFLGNDSDESYASVEIEITKARVRSNFNAVMWGPMAGADGIKGTVTLKNGEGREVDQFEVSVSYALGGIAGGQDSARMDWLYEEFAKKAVGELSNQTE
ncbi:MAG: DUF4410 domain-containing protein [Verrucomicrobiota bacterium]